MERVAIIYAAYTHVTNHLCVPSLTALGEMEWPGPSHMKEKV